MYKLKISKGWFHLICAALRSTKNCLVFGISIGVVEKSSLLVPFGCLGCENNNKLDFNDENNSMVELFCWMRLEFALYLQ
jgi:hypothetical protein